MPFDFNGQITSVTLVNNKTIQISGDGFGANQYPVSNIQIRKNSVTGWTSVDIIDSWTDTYIVGSFNSVLSNAGIYHVKVISSDNIEYTLNNAFDYIKVTKSINLNF